MADNLRDHQLKGGVRQTSAHPHASATVIIKKRTPPMLTAITIDQRLASAAYISTSRIWPGSAQIASVAKSAEDKVQTAALAEGSKAQHAAGQDYRRQAKRIDHSGAGRPAALCLTHI